MGKSADNIPPVNLLNVSQAQERLLASFHPLESTWIGLENSVGCVLAENILAPMNLPHFTNSSMDGFAVQARDCLAASRENPIILRVVADIPAGTVSETKIYPGQAARIMTGAPLPAGGDAVVPVEDTDFNFRAANINPPALVSIYKPVQAGQNIRQVGEDIHQGDVVIPAGKRIRPQEVGFLGMLGVTKVSVHRKPRLAIFSTGDELIGVGKPLLPGKIYDANTYSLVALAKKYNCEPVQLGIIPDQKEAVRDCLQRAAASGVDIIISSAGVSVGAFDFVRTVVEQDGSLDFWRVNMRPGKPLVFGHYQGIPFFGLPGNPVSAFVSFEVFVRPALLRLQGWEHWQPFFLRGYLLDAIQSDGRETYIRVVVSREDGKLVARLTGHQGSGNLHSLVQGNALLVVPSGVKSLAGGSEVDIWLLDEV